MNYYIIDYDRYKGCFTEDQLIEYAEEEQYKDQLEYVPESSLAHYPNLNLEDALEYLTQCCKLTVIRGEEI
jgi:hypothetical protein